MPVIPGNPLFHRVCEELELYLSPRRASEILDQALKQVGSSPQDAGLGHMVQIVDQHLRTLLIASCHPQEADELLVRVSAVLDELASKFFSIA